MKKLALVFVLAVLTPSLILASLALRSLRDQRFLLEHQQSLLYQGVADGLAKEVNGFLSDQQHEFALQVESIMASTNAGALAGGFDERLRQAWPLAGVGFIVTDAGDITCPAPTCTGEALQFRMENAAFLGSRQAAEVYWASKTSPPELKDPGPVVVSSNPPNPRSPSPPPLLSESKAGPASKSEKRIVSPVQGGDAAEVGADSKLSATPAEFKQLIGDANEGLVARFVQNKLELMTWYRPPRERHLIFGAQLNLARLIGQLRILAAAERTGPGDICLALLDDAGLPIAQSQPHFQTNWKRPFVASEIGEALPHWEAAVYLRNPNRLEAAAETSRWTLGLLISVLLLAIGAGSWLIVHCLQKELELARQKTDFVSNVSHELKTPLTSIRMFSELLANGRVHDVAKQRSYLQIIAAETGRLTRLINNVLDFARLERGQKEYKLQSCDLAELAGQTVESFRPQLEASGFHLSFSQPGTPLAVQGDRDALAQVVVNLLSNAEKYSNGSKEITVEARLAAEDQTEVRVLDRGTGVLKGAEQRIFEKFYRAHDSLSSGIQGSGLGLTLARQIARAHGGDVTYEPREGGGSCFTLSLPKAP